MSRVKSNPLSTRFVEPGRIAWQALDSHQSLDAIVARFIDQLNYRGAIVGPHGSGKSTLLAHLVPLLGDVALKSATFPLPQTQRSAPSTTTPDGAIPGCVQQPVPRRTNRKIVWLQLRGRAASAQLLSETRPQWCAPDRLLIIDGYEQLSFLSRAKVVWLTKRKAVGLLITSHRRTSVPTLIETQVDVALAEQLLDQLLPVDLPDREKLMNAPHISQLLDRHDGNLREVFMQLYDEIEQWNTK